MDERSDRPLPPRSGRPLPPSGSLAPCLAIDDLAANLKGDVYQAQRFLASDRDARLDDVSTLSCVLMRSITKNVTSEPQKHAQIGFMKVLRLME